MILTYVTSSHQSSVAISLVIIDLYLNSFVVFTRHKVNGKFTVRSLRRPTNYPERAIRRFKPQFIC
ncbi:hypothetical protein K450DRAFT_225709 [Umbelopsis ramanniana AG]|uniref:Uncharacterized protein n=1 Tax=Umbelopsis ramanniana AG TaxID=1314678 RepID=A0AAD5HHD8_UMBRA|nr:uncharacterized protein K450DRAFT_225709 [Umbelopsis ramanniana AG]KAI8582974.1 hypothetical protein K450DRAFT_225709 [Umbelopsis ramanniana AG]